VKGSLGRKISFAARVGVSCWGSLPYGRVSKGESLPQESSSLRGVFPKFIFPLLRMRYAPEKDVTK
jgi:hypothetical protein